MYDIILRNKKDDVIFGLAVVGGRIINRKHGRVINLPIPNSICGSGDGQINQISAFE